MRVQSPSGVPAFVEVLVGSTRPLNFNFILDMNGVSAFRGVTVHTPSDVQFGVDEDVSSAAAADVATNCVINEKDFTVTYDVAAKEWILSWKWCDGQEPACLVNTTSEYKIQPDARQEYERELSQWIADGWLVPHDERRHGPVKGTIPLMAVVQRNKEKVRPVLDFRSASFNDFARRWGIRVIYRCAHVPSGNGISERCHRTVKTIAARKPCTIPEAVYRYNVMPRDDNPSFAPANRLFRYEVRLLGLDAVSNCEEEDNTHHRFMLGDRVWVRHPSRRCNARSSIGTVTKILSPQKVEVDGLPRHVRDLRQATQPPQSDEASAGNGTTSEDKDSLWIRLPAIRDDLIEAEGHNESEEDSPGRPVPCRGSRERHPVRPFQYNDLL